MRIYTEASAQDPVALWLRVAEDFIAIQVANFISVVFAHLRNILGGTLVALALLLLAFTSYPFEPQRLLLLILQAAIVTVAVASVLVFVLVEHDEVLSRIAGTKPNAVSWDRGFVLAVLTYGALPLLTVVATAFPPLGDIFSFLDPVLRVIK